MNNTVGQTPVQVFIGILAFQIFRIPRSRIAGVMMIMLGLILSTSDYFP